MFGRQKMYRAGVADAMQANAEFMQKQQAATEHVQHEVSQAIELSILDYIIYQLFSKLFIFIYLERIIIKGFQEFFKFIHGNHIPMLMIHLIKEHKELVQTFFI